MFPLPLNIYFEIAAFIVSVFCWKSLMYNKLYWFIPFLFLIVCVELTARYLFMVLKEPNAWLYALSIPFEYFFYTVLFSNFYKTLLYKKIAFGFLILFGLYSVVSGFYITKLQFFDMNILVIANFAMFIFSILYFLELYNSTDTTNIYQSPFFWIVIGIFLFNSGEFCYNLLSMLLIDEGFDATLKVFQSINNSLILVLYSSFIIGFICQKILGTSTKD